ncbi:uncharacterized protein LOC128989150 [Macrosteles quadrilineatus]|uniref:uncharacterized protein LOC128989150 n=1 Tax=Macrosteles quadrilineatus TaxID=74068 RepID=UPI0023E14A2A|nr:uncharacterized protein LOC128989150 [Macrosteles quadrilineatus]
MDKFFKPERLSLDPNDPHSDRQWKHWKTTFKNFVEEICAAEDDLLKLLTNFVDYNIHEIISEADSYTEAISILDKLFIKPTNEVYSRHQLATRRQEPGENIDQYLRKLKELSKACNFKSVTANENRNEYIRDAFIRGLISQSIRQRLLENLTLTLEEAYNQAITLESAENQAVSYISSPCNSISQSTPKDVDVTDTNVSQAASDSSSHQLSSIRREKCFFCGRSRHSRANCPAKDSVCNICDKKGHWATVCNSRNQSRTFKGKTTQSDKTKINSMSSSLVAASQKCLSKATVSLMLNGKPVDALIDTGSSDSFISEATVKRFNIFKYPTKHEISMASTSHVSSTLGHCTVDMVCDGHEYPLTKLLILTDLCADVVIGHDILRQHSAVELNFGGKRPPFNVCNLLRAKVSPPPLFDNLTNDVKPVAIKSRRYSEDDSKFIKSEVSRLISEGIIEPSKSPWRAQVIVVNNGHKRRLCIDYSQTINKFTQLDAYPLPHIESFVSKLAQYKVFSTIDLKEAYHQIPIRNEDKPFTAFEANGRLYQYTRIPFGVTNGVACFQRTIDQIIENENLLDTFAYLDDVTICGRSQAEHDQNLQRFMEATKKYNLTLNKEKSKFSLTSIPVLGYIVENMSMRPDPDRLQSLLNFPVPTDNASLKRALGMLSYYAKWIPKFSEKVHCLTTVKSFPVGSKEILAFKTLKEEIANSSMSAVEENIPFTVETDASESAIAATLSQAGRPICFFSRTLTKSEQHLPAVEKEALAIFDSIQKWRHFLIGRRFKLITDQKSVSYMFNQKHAGKVKNNKILKWRLELAPFSYDIVYRSGKENVVADAFSRVSSSISCRDFEKLRRIHCDIGHPGIVRMVHFLKSKNLPYSIEDVRRMTASCSVCAEVKPRFYQKTPSTLIHAMAPFERLNIDFKGPIPSVTRNKYILTVVDEFSRYPFAIPCSDTSASSVIKALTSIFTIFGMPAFVHSDQGSAFMSKELSDFLHSKGIATSRSSPYNPRGNSQAERYNGTIWKTVSLVLRNKGLKTEQWEYVLPEALHCIRSLLCTATNETPHERLFKHQRRSFYGTSQPQWLMNPGPVLVRRHVRNNKYEPLVEQAQLIEANPDYARIKYRDGREALVSVRHLAVPPEAIQQEDEPVTSENPSQELDPALQDLRRESNLLQPEIGNSIQSEIETSPLHETVTPTSVRDNEETNLRRSTRVRRPPTYLRDYI